MQNQHFNITTRITALWAFSEAFLGGILHGFKIPFAGLGLSLIASLCLTLIALHTGKKGAVIKATLVVMVVKCMLSPHTPPMAYAAVFIEGLAGELFFLQRRYVRSASFLLTLFCLMYSAIQHLLILTVIFGNGLWAAMDIFLNGITKTFIKQPQHYSLILVIFYLGCYFVAGVLGGLLNQKIVKQVQSGLQPALITTANKKLDEGVVVAEQKNKGANNKNLLLKYAVAFILLTLLIISYTPLFTTTLLKNKVTEVIIRGVLILFAWNFLLSPLLVKFIKRWVQRYQHRPNTSLPDVLLLLPHMRQVVQVSWQLSQQHNKLKQFSSFISNTAMLIIYAR
jgi:hypothetical protein